MARKPALKSSPRLPSPRRPSDARRGVTPAKSLGSLDPQRRAEQRRRLLKAAARIFAKGLGKASVAAIVKEAGMSRRTFYEHFDDMTDAFLQLYESGASRLFYRVESEYRAQTDQLGKLRAGLGAYLRQTAENADLARIVYREIRAAGPEQALRHQGTLQRYVALVSEWVAEARVNDIVKRPPDELTVYTVVAGIEAAAMRFVDRGEEQRLVAHTDTFVDLVVRAFQ